MTINVRFPFSALALNALLMCGNSSSVFSSSSSSSSRRSLSSSNIPNTGQEQEPGQTLLDGKTEFQPPSSYENDELSPSLAKLHLRHLTSGQQQTSNSNVPNPFQTIYKDGSDTYYDEYSQAWRVIGFYIDCDYCGYDSYTGRLLSDAECLSSTTSSNNNNNGRDDYNYNYYNHYQYNGNNNYQQQQQHRGCQRFLLWAAVSNFVFGIYS